MEPIFVVRGKAVIAPFEFTDVVLLFGSDAACDNKAAQQKKNTNFFHIVQ